MKVMSLGGLAVVMIPALVSAASVELAAYSDRPLCEKMVTLLGERLNAPSELSKTVEWTAVELKGEGPKIRRCSSLDKANIDLNNDGRDDLVVKTTFCMKGVPSDSFYVFPADSQVLDQLSWQDMRPLLATQDKFERTGGTYPLTSLPMDKASTSPALSAVFTIQPFRLDGVAYIGLTDARREWMVIAKYRGGERFEDLCYLRAEPN
ncbi:hypothetical protein [Candidatus Nitrospira nitrificans]|uniref:Uncharacterized protein n=1 Tax=Candidatus Nitrospira nitrificans TaxID=1742973 RepID=A0A0S4LB26_9BACT|nr:hypothetical protein [Candidatus Nitrospira nitrificans]CUS33046.1 exported hypothetical protein [Candidatus Nitrospira nitrificans]